MHPLNLRIFTRTSRVNMGTQEIKNRYIEPHSPLAHSSFYLLDI